MNANTKQTLKSLSFNRDAEHQLEFIGDFNGVSFINDSKSTDIKHTVSNIDSLDTEIVLIIGGQDERTDYSLFLNISTLKIKSVIYIGKNSDKLFRLFLKQDCLLTVANDLEHAVTLSKYAAKKDQLVLFSPACPSYEAFDNYKNRGNKFKELVLKENSRTEEIKD